MEKGKGYILLYDLKSLPGYMRIATIHRLIKEDGVCYYDSSSGTDKPKVIHLGGENGKELLDVKLIDWNLLIEEERQKIQNCYGRLGNKDEG